jgi:hypothetical protein
VKNIIDKMEGGCDPDERRESSALERGKQNITPGAVSRLAAAFDLSLRDLLVDR